MKIEKYTKCYKPISILYTITIFVIIYVNKIWHVRFRNYVYLLYTDFSVLNVFDVVKNSQDKRIAKVNKQYLNNFYSFKLIKLSY